MTGLTEGSPAVASAGARRWLPLILAVAIFAGALTLFALGLSRRTPDLMESQDLEITTNFFRTMSIPVDQSPAFYLLNHCWIDLYRHSFAYLRLLSAIFAALAAAVVFYLAKMESGYAGGVSAALFLATNALVIDQARTARTYALVLLAASLCLLFAYLYLVRAKRLRYLVGFVVSTVLAVYTHLFLLVLVGPLTVMLIVDLYRNRPDQRTTKRVYLVGGIGLLATLPQLGRVFAVLGYAESRQGVYGSMTSGKAGFFEALTTGFFAGEGTARAAMWPVAAAVIVLTVIGVVVLKRRGLIAGLTLVLPTVLIGFYLSLKTPMYPRYLIYVLPVAACLIGGALARLRKAYLWAPLAVALAATSLLAARVENTTPDPNWSQAVKFVESVRQPDDVVAVFPDYWMYTFRRFYPDDHLGAFTFVPDLDRIRARGRRVIIVASIGRPLDNVSAYLKNHARVLDHWDSKDQAGLRVIVVDREPPTTVELTKAEEPTVLIGGMVGSGGYPWQLEPPAGNPFAGLSPAFKSADLTITGFVPYRPPWFLWALWGPRRYGSFKPNPQVARFLAEAGVNAVALLSPGDAPVDLLTAAGLRSIPLQPAWNKSAPQIFDVRGVKVGVLHCGQRVFTDRPNYRDKGEAVVADWETGIRRAKEAVGPAGRLIVFFPQTPDYDHLFHGEEQMVARRAVDLGADVVVGMGSWANKEVEEYKNGVIAYSLGTLLRPGNFVRSTLESTGALLRVTFPAGQKPQTEMLPIIVDDQFRVVFARPEAGRNLALAPLDDPAHEHLLNNLLSAKVFHQSATGAKHLISGWSNELSAPASWADRQLVRFQDMVTSWFPRWAPFRYAHEGYTDKHSTVGVEGVVAMETFRRALVFEPERGESLSVTWPQVRLGEHLLIVYGVGNHAIHDKYRAPAAQTLTVSVGAKELLKKTVPCIVGWKNAVLDTKQFAGAPQDVTITVTAGAKTQYPLSVDAIVERSPETIAALAQFPYSFEDHIREARMIMKAAGGRTTECFGPDETFRYLRGGARRSPEEHGPSGEGVLHTRWVCGALPWDCAALTLQRSGGELRRAIWLHPVAKTQRSLIYGPLALRTEIRGYYGITDLAFKAAKKPVTFSIFVGDRQIWREKLAGKRGWQTFAAAIPPDLQNQSAEVSFMVETPDQNWRHLCFNAWMQ